MHMLRMDWCTQTRPLHILCSSVDEWTVHNLFTCGSQNCY